jgi:formamidopyrimidine-DNA glycosylase
LYLAGIRPSRHGKTLTIEDCTRLHAALRDVISHAVEVGADKDKFPSTWLFHYRWGGAKGDEVIDGQSIIREQIGGRTTAWVPTRQD